MKYDPAFPLFVPPAGRFALKDTEAALSATLADPGKPLLIYIHGRAKGVGEPKKSLDQGIYRDLNAYAVNTIGFTWDADDGGYDPSRAEASVPAFLTFLQKTMAFYNRAENKILPRPSLITHSMGAIIVAELAKNGDMGPGKPAFFKNLVLSAAAVKTKRHDRWLCDISIAKKIYVTVNEGDVVLGFAGILFKPDMLGRDLRGPGVIGGRVSYVDVSQLDLNHRYFVKPKQKGHASIFQFYEQTLTGRPAKLEAISAPGERDGVPVAVLRPN
jgi:hypothetical protein